MNDDLIKTFVLAYAVTLCVLMIIVPMWSESKSFSVAILAIAAVVCVLAGIAVRVTS